MKMYDIIIIGAGIIGGSIARELSRYDLDVAVLEAREDVATATTGTNSAIVHAGYDRSPDTHMARLNVQGNRLYDQIKSELNIPFKRVGSLVLAFDESDQHMLEILLRQGKESGIEGLKIIPQEEVLDREPNVNPQVLSALWAPTGGITCPYELTVGYVENAVDNGVKIFLNHPVIEISRDGDGSFIIVTPKGEFRASYIVNCAGVNSDEIPRMLGVEEFSIKPRRGEYLLYDRKYGDTVNSVIFQTPSEISKGVLITQTVDGNLLVGPNAEDLEGKGDISTTDSGLDYIYNAGKKSIPTLTRRGVIRTFAGLRAIADTGDFIIGPSKKIEGLFHAAGISSPGLSAAPAIAKEMVAILDRHIGPLTEKGDFNPYRSPIPRFRDLNRREQQELIDSDPRYGRVICRCETVTEGEIVEALRRSVPVTTIDGIKRRTRAGMGRCQGGFCTPRIMDIMSRELDIPIESISKSRETSNIVIGKIREDHGEVRERQ